MLGRTHAIGGVASIIAADIIYGGYHVNVPTAFTVTLAALIGALTPDLDDPGSLLYQKIPAGSFLGKLIHPFFVGGHRHLSHSLLGFGIFAYLSHGLLSNVPSYMGINTHIVWIAYLIGIASHLILDAMTIEGIPIFFPIPTKIGIPPLKDLRVKTGGFVEHIFVLPLLIFFIGYAYIHYYFIFLH